MPRGASVELFPSDWLFRARTGHADLRPGGLQRAKFASTRHPPIKPLPDPIPLKIEFPTNKIDKVIEETLARPTASSLCIDELEDPGFCLHGIAINILSEQLQPEERKD